MRSTDEGWYVTVEIQQQNVKFKLDTGARCNVLSKHIYENLHFCSQLMKTNTRLVSYSGNVMQVEGEVMLDIHYIKGRIIVCNFMCWANQQRKLYWV